jgi:acetyl-CoA C-acetyltransferase
MRELGIEGTDRPLTVTGGLGFAGGPVNNYPTHAIARMVELLRADPEAIGLTTALGWYVTKHAAGVWSARPPAGGFRRVDPLTTQAKVDATPRRVSAGAVDGDATTEATSVAFERDGSPTTGLLTARLDDGRRAIAVCRDQALLTAFTTEPWEGRTVRLAHHDGVNEVVR